MGSIAAGLAAFATGFISYMSLPLDAGPASAGLPAGDSAFPFNAAHSQTEPPSGHLSFSERFSFDPSRVPGRSLQLSQTSASFDDRFGGQGLAPTVTIQSAAQSAVAPVGATAPRVAAAAAARSVRKQTPETRFQLASVSDTALPLAYAPTDAVKDSAVTGSGLKGLRPKDSNPLADVDTRHTAIYDITSHTVHLPNGRRLEAHSGLGSHMDDPGYAHARMTGPTPPNVYELTLRESLFHGVRAIRLVPTDDTKMHGRSGILAHSYLLGPSGQSNGCVSFSDYPAFLDSYLRGEVKRLVVVERLAGDAPKSASDWFSNTLKDIFRRS